MDDSWLSGDPYEYYMGRWSSRVAGSFVDWLSLSPGLEWLDIGCGSGALSESILNKQNPEKVTAIDQSEGFVKTAQKRLGNRVNCRVGNAFDLPLEDASVNAAISGLVLNFLPEPEKALIEMKRVTAPGGCVAVYVWDYVGQMDLLNYFWDTAVELNPKALNLHEGRRFPDADSEGLKNIFKRAGFSEIKTAPLVINTDFRDFVDYWQPFLGGEGPAPTYVLSLDEAERDKLRDALLERLPIQANGTIPMVARAWGAKSIVDE